MKASKRNLIEEDIEFILKKSKKISYYKFRRYSDFLTKNPSIKSQALLSEIKTRGFHRKSRAKNFFEGDSIYV